jgi:hypothetical protein
MAGTAQLDREHVRQALIALLDHAGDTFAQLQYCLIGTAAAVLRGVPMQAADIDLLMRDRADVDRFSSALAAFPCLSPPAFLAEAKQYYAAYQVQGATIEASTVEWPTDSACIETLGDGPWLHFTSIQCGRYQIPTIALELRLVSELLRERPDRYRPLIAWLHTNGCDIELLGCAMKARAIPEGRQAQVLHAITSSA